MARSPARLAYDALTSEADRRDCLDIPDEICAAQPTNFVRHVVALTATKTGDGLADPKLVLSWLLGALGAPAWQIGFLVPIREAGSLLPQLVVAGWLSRLRRRKWAWAGAALAQGVAVLAMAGAAATLRGPALGAAILGSLTAFALARSVASVSYKVVLGRTVSKTTRGTASGAAATASAAFVLLFGVLVSAGVVPLEPGMVAVALLVAAGLWAVAAVVFSGLREVADADAPGGSLADTMRHHLSLFRAHPQLRRLVAVRGLLLATALAPPFVVALSGRGASGGFGRLGPFVVASSAASVTSSYVWGRLADVSSRRVLIRAAMLATAPLAAMAGLAWTRPELLQLPPVLPGLLFVLMVAYQGVRLGRSTHVVDMADAQTRAAFTALSNSAVGVLLVTGGLFGLLAEWSGPATVLAVFAGMCAVAAVVARELDEVQT